MEKINRRKNKTNIAEVDNMIKYKELKRIIISRIKLYLSIRVKL